jgi:hypothetical protein
MELSAEVLNDIDVYVKDVLKVEAVAKAKSKLKKAYETKGEADAGVQKFLLWRSYELKLKEMKAELFAINSLMKKFDYGLSSQEVYADLNRENILTKRKLEILTDQNQRLVDKNIKLTKQNKQEISNRAALLRAKEKEKQYNEKITVITELRKENRELISERDYFKQRCTKLENEIAPKADPNHLSTKYSEDEDCGYFG